MPTWGEVQEYVRSKYKLSRDEGDWFSMVWAWNDQQGRERRQLIVCRKMNAFNSEWLDFSSAICKESQLPHKTALLKNAEFAVGSIILDNDTYLFRYSLPMATMDPDEFELPLWVIARTADELEAQFTGGDNF